jgi:Tfp pilus assembly protein PilX
MRELVRQGNGWVGVRGRGASARVRSEDGIALIVALGVMMVLAIMVVSVTYYVSANSGAAARSSSDETAFSLAEAGLNDAFSVLQANYPATYPGNPNLLPGTTITYPGGSVTYSGKLSLLNATWTVTSTSTVHNPTGPSSADVQRTVSAVVPVNLDGTTATVPPAWNTIYSGGTGQVCDMTLQQSVQLSAPLYVAGNLCLQNTASITQPVGGSGDRLFVGGTLTLSQNANTVGSKTAPLNEAHILGACQYKNNAATNPCQANTSNTNVWVAAGGFYHTAPTPPIPAPTVDWWGNYQRAAPGPFRPCFTSVGTPPVFELPTETTSAIPGNMNADVPGVFNLTPSASYTCKSGDGQLSWNATSRVLTVNGSIFIDGSVSVDTGWAGNVVSTYIGQAVLYIYGTVLIKNSSLCAVVQGNGCNQTAGAWDPNTTALIIAAHGDGSQGGVQAQVPNGDSIQLKSANFQGGLYGNSNIEVNTTSQAQGPLVSPHTILPGQTGTISFPSIQFAPYATPGTTTLPNATLSTPLNYNG